MTTIKKTKHTRLIWLFTGAAAMVLLGSIWLFKPASDTLKVNPFRVSGGWGYDVSAKGRTYIHQPFIPGVIGRKPFPDRKSALRAGKMVRAKLVAGHVPALTHEDLAKIGIDTTLTKW
jgi:hypothetical protein